MSLLKTLTTDESITNERDSVGGGGVLNSDLYPLTVALAYVKESDGGALGLNVTFKTEDGKDVRQVFWMTSGKAKGQKNYYEKDGVKHYLPGFNMANALSLLTIGKEIGELDTEEKVIKLYSSEANSEVPTKVQMVTALLGQEIIAGVLKQIVDKTKQDPTTKEYLPTGETREENEVDKLFRVKDKMTVAEIRAQETEPKFYTTWGEKWIGKTRDRSTKNGGTTGAPKATGTAKPAASKPTSSLFG
jgi:hypothetical protein